MEIIRYPAGVYQANCYIVYDETTNEGFIIDPGGNAREIMKVIKDKNIKPLFIILTHGHFDHIGGVNEIKSKLGIPLYINKNDEYLLSEGTRPGMMFPSKISDVAADGFVKDGDTLNCGKLSIEIIHTPGHTPGGITIKTSNVLFTGDTLFKGSVGRTDFPKGSQEEIIKSIEEKIICFPDETAVYPGHGPSTTIGDEKKYNPFL